MSVEVIGRSTQPPADWLIERRPLPSPGVPGWVEGYRRLRRLGWDVTVLVEEKKFRTRRDVALIALGMLPTAATGFFGDAAAGEVPPADLHRASPIRPVAEPDNPTLT